jgi:acetyl-CoA C-acetyltransferase
MAKKVGICAVAQTTFERNKKDIRFQGMAMDVLDALREQVDVTFSRHVKGATGVDMTISVSDDLFDARTISNNAMTDVLGAHFGCEEKIAQEGIQALYYGLAAIQSGHNDKVLIMGHCKESQGQSRNMVTHVAFDPFFTRPVGLDFCAAAGLQAQAYGEKAGLTDEQLAKIVVRARENASKNPYTQDIGMLSAEDIMDSAMLADPIRELHAYPVSDGAVGMILATEDVAKKICDNPIWITGVGNCMDSFFLGDRDLTSNFALKKAVEHAYKRAGITDPQSAFDIVEVSDQYAYQLPMWAEGIGLCGEGKGADWLNAGGLEKHNVNTSGGMLAGNPLILGGLVRAAEAAFQLRGEAGDRQVENAKTAIAHGVMGPAGQFHSVVTLERD